MSEPTMPKLDDVPFTGRLTFDLTFVLLGKAVVRKLRIDYGYRPEWDYFDPETRTIVPGGPEQINTVPWLQVPPPDEAEVSYLADTHGHRIETDELLKSNGKPRTWQDWTEPRWLRADTLNEKQVLPLEMWDMIDAAIDDRCRAEDARRRMKRTDTTRRKPHKRIKRRRRGSAEPKAPGR